MTTSLDLCVVIPALNEELRLPQTLASYAGGLRGRRAEIIVVDDGSTDGTSAVVRRAGQEGMPVRLIRLPRNRGKGYAVRVGMLSATARRVLFADADGATRIGEITRLETAIDGGADLAIGSRERAATDVKVQTTSWRRFSGRLFHQVVRYAGVRGIADTQCGFKLFPQPVAEALFGALRTNGFAFDVELLLLAQRRGLRVAEVPINWVHQPGSKVSVVRDGLRMARDVLRMRVVDAAARFTPAMGTSSIRSFVD